ncbi:unnamed protein product [Closterium sp. NIES-64]|nr:unnamed protein product [Closterium sp. NIES-64]
MAHFFEDWETHVSTRMGGTWGYIDPDYLHTNPLSPKADTYAFGVFLLELVFGYPPHEKELTDLKKKHELLNKTRV